MPLRVMVIGAGLGGLALASALARAGVDVIVYERDPASDSRAQGARFHVDDRGVRALRACLSAEQFAFFEATTGPPSESRREIGQVDGRWELLEKRPFTGTDGIPDKARPGWPASRWLVRRLLMSGVADRVRFGKELVRYEPRPDGGVRAMFADGGTDVADVLVGADGVGSVVRRQYLPNAGVADTGIRWLGGKTPLTAQVLATGILDLIEGSFTITELDEVGMILGVVRFQEPPTVAAARLLPGFDPGDTEDYVMWAVLPGRERVDRSGVDLHTATGAEMWALVTELTRRAHPDLRLIIDQAWPEQSYSVQVATAIPGEPWPPSTVTLLGDAIHAMPPNGGSGANTAFQDARRLAAKFIAVDRGELDLLSAVADYEDQMRRDGFEAVNAAVRGISSFVLRAHQE